MTPRQKIELRQSEVRQRLNELVDIDAPTEEQTAELETLSKESGSLETRQRAAILSEPDGSTPTPSEDGEGRELREIRNRADFGAYIAAALERRSVVNGAELELNQAMHIPLNDFPLEMLLGDVETRAAIPTAMHKAISRRGLTDCSAIRLPCRWALACLRSRLVYKLIPCLSQMRLAHRGGAQRRQRQPL